MRFPLGLAILVHPGVLVVEEEQLTEIAATEIAVAAGTAAIVVVAGTAETARSSAPGILSVAGI